jgi:hypothetical protein
MKGIEKDSLAYAGLSNFNNTLKKRDFFQAARYFDV